MIRATSAIGFEEAALSAQTAATFTYPNLVSFDIVSNSTFVRQDGTIEYMVDARIVILSNNN